MKISNLPVASAVTGAETVPIVQGENTVRTSLSDLGKPMVDAAQAAATQAEGFALALETSTAGGWFSSLEAGAASATVAEGEGFFVNDGVNFYTGQKVNGVGVRMASFNTMRDRKQLLSEGLPILSMGTESAVTSEASDYIKEFLDLANTYGGGELIFPSKGYVFECGGDPFTNGDFTYVLSGESTVRSTPFNRGIFAIGSNVTLRGNGAKLMLAPGYTCPPALFSGKPWEGEQKSNFHVEGLEFDGNMANQIIFPVNANTPYPPWLFGSCISHSGVSNVSARRCLFRNWRGMGMGGGGAPEYGLVGDDYLAEHCEFLDNFNGSIQWGPVRRARTLYNRHHGSGGWTAFVDIEVESEADGYEMLDIWSIGEVFDGRDGHPPVESFLTHYATDSAEAIAAAAATTYRRGYCLSGNYSTPSTNLDVNGNPIFNGMKGRVSIIGAKCWQSNISCGGVDRVTIDGPQIDITYEASAVLMHPNDINAISAAPANNTNPGTGLSEFKVRDATIRTDMPAYGFVAGGCEWVEFSGTVTGGRRSGIRLEACGGKVDARIKNCGGIADTNDTDFAGDMSSGFFAIGNTGPMEVNLHVTDTRGAGAIMKYAATINAGASHQTNITIQSATGLIVGGVHDVNNSCLIEDRSAGAVSINRKVTMAAGFEAHDNIAFVSTAGPLTVAYRTPAGDGNNVNQNFYPGGVLRQQIAQLTTGYTNFNMFAADGSVEGIPIQLKANGKAIIATEAS